MGIVAVSRTSAAFLAYESLGAVQAPAPSQAIIPSASPTTTSYLQTGDPPVTGETPPGAVATAVADAANLSDRIAANLADPLTSRVASLHPGVTNKPTITPKTNP